MSSRRTKLGRSIVLSATTMLGLLGASTGCSSLSGFQNEVKYNRSWDDFVSGYRNNAWSAKAWHNRKHRFCKERYLHDFCKGFRAGYESVADGSNGCTPAFAPREYWGWRYQSAEGQAKVASWLAGYPHGARAAEEDGVGNWTQIQTSTGIQSEYAQFGMMQSSQQGLYPIPAAGGQPTGQSIPSPEQVSPIPARDGDGRSILNSAIEEPQSIGDVKQLNLNDVKN